MTCEETSGKSDGDGIQTKHGVKSENGVNQKERTSWTEETRDESGKQTVMMKLDLHSSVSCRFRVRARTRTHVNDQGVGRSPARKICS